MGMDPVFTGVTIPNSELSFRTLFRCAGRDRLTENAIGSKFRKSLKPSMAILLGHGKKVPSIATLYPKD